MITVSYTAGGRSFACGDSDENLAFEVSASPSHLVLTVRAKTEIKLVSASTSLCAAIGAQDLVFANGYQSWTETKEFTAKEKLNDLALLPPRLVERFAFKSYGSQSFARMKKDFLLGFDYAYIRGENSLFVGSRNYKNAYLLIRVRRKEGRIDLESDVFGKRLQPGESFTVFDYFTSADPDAGMREYFAPMTPKTHKKLFGYTSWYNHYQNISEDVIRSALNESDERFELFQIDDGFETFVGDWEDIDPDKFPNGLNGIVEEIHKKDMLAGIWLAPLVAETKSKVFSEHPDWIRRHADGTPVAAGSNWSGFYALDLDKEEVVGHIVRSLKKYVDLGFDFFKLDFLYASNLSKMHDKTRAETSEFIYGKIRETLKSQIILGCGATLSNAYEKFEYLRVGPDISLKFDDVWFMRFFHPERISTKVTLCNTVFRSPSDGKAYGNDPDVFLLRDEGLELSASQRYAILMINSLFGSLLMTSDNPKRYDKEKRDLLDRALKLRDRATVLSYKREKDTLKIRYEADGQIHAFTYHIKKGIITDER